MPNLSHIPFIPNLHPCLKTAKAGDTIVFLYDGEKKVEGTVLKFVVFEFPSYLGVFNGPMYNQHRTILIDTGHSEIKFYPKYDKIIFLKRKK